MNRMDFKWYLIQCSPCTLYTVGLERIILTFKVTSSQGLRTLPLACVHVCMWDVYVFRGLYWRGSTVHCVWCQHSYTVNHMIPCARKFLWFAVHSVSADNFNLQKLINNYKLCLCHATCSKTALLLSYLVQIRRQHQLTLSELTNLPLNQDLILSQVSSTVLLLHQIL
jgi:hypothetical protein